MNCHDLLLQLKKVSVTMIAITRKHSIYTAKQTVDNFLTENEELTKILSHPKILWGKVGIPIKEIKYLEKKSCICSFLCETVNSYELGSSCGPLKAHSYLIF